MVSVYTMLIIEEETKAEYKYVFYKWLASIQC